MASVSGTITSGGVSSKFQPSSANTPINASVWGGGGGVFYLTQAPTAAGPFAVVYQNGMPVILTFDNGDNAQSINVPYSAPLTQPWFFQIACTGLASGPANYSISG